MSQSNQSLWIGVKDAARLLGISTRSIYRHKDDVGWPKYVTFCQTTRWRRAEFMEWIDRQVTGFKE